jgi:hypothetical protein
MPNMRQSGVDGSLKARHLCYRQIALVLASACLYNMFTCLEAPILIVMSHSALCAKSRLGSTESFHILLYSHMCIYCIESNDLWYLVLSLYLYLLTQHQAYFSLSSHCTSSTDPSPYHLKLATLSFSR